MPKGHDVRLLTFEPLPSNPSPGPLPDEVHRDSGPPSPLGRGLTTRTHKIAALSLGERVAIPQSRESRVRGPFSSSEVRHPSNLGIWVQGRCSNSRQGSDTLMRFLAPVRAPRGTRTANAPRQPKNGLRVTAWTRHSSRLAGCWKTRLACHSEESRSDRDDEESRPAHDIKSSEDEFHGHSLVE